jgi:hypothetical protein
MSSTGDPILISYENDINNENSKFFFETVKHNDWEFQHVGAGDKWEGWITRMKAYRDVCSRYDKDRILVFSDARDVFCVRHSKAFKAAFEYFNTPIIMSAGMFLSSCIDVKENFVHGNGASLEPYFNYWKIKPGLRKFVCAGLMAGRAGALYEMWDWIIANNYKDDQLGAAMFIRTFPERVKLDLDAILLHSSEYGIDAGIYHIHLQKQDAPTLAELFGTNAFFLHIPGSGAYKGQGYVYNSIKNILKDIPSNPIIKEYGKPFPPWDMYKDLPPQKAQP